ncbi:MAG: aspartate carbamoyltransferase regulatory subunit [Bacteroidaceae bacterium]|nr:aspartate carbamoyltransferase regulatory subunit [Bacteroidaceae bacterium]
MKRQELQVAALENGTVIDHIPSAKIFEVINLLHLENVSTSVTIGINLKSKKMGHKSILKIADRFFTDEELNQLSVVTPNVSLAIIRDYEVVEKKQVKMPNELIGIIKCDNHKCITNNEPMRTHFHVLDKEKGILQCRYCNREVTLNNVKLI